jgi:hypothetical protein
MRVLATLVNASRTTASATRRAEVTVSTGARNCTAGEKPRAGSICAITLTKGPRIETRIVVVA